MSYTITPSDDGTYIILTVKGEINRKKAMRQNLEAHALGRQLGINRYLVDITQARNTETVKNNYDFAYTDMHRTEGLDMLARVAALISPGDHSHDFFETVARNSGLNFTLFTDPDKARQHLMQD